MPQLSISPSGEITAIYSDELVELIEQGKATIRRVSDVEPCEWGGWSVRMRIGGDIYRRNRLAMKRFRTRSAALAAEIAYLENKLF